MAARYLRRSLPPPRLLIAWTLFTWGTRLRNAAGDDEPASAFVVPVVLCVLAVVALVRARVAPLLAVAGSAAWLVRAPIILLGDHGVAFKVVHTGLAAITWVLSGLVLRARRRAPVSGTARLRRPSGTR